MKNMVSKIMWNYGQKIQLEQEGAVAICHGFFQPVRATDLQQLHLKVEEFGRIPGGKYQMMVPPEVAFSVGTRVFVGGDWYLVRAVEVISGGYIPVYRWGLLVKEGEVDGDIS